MVRFIFIVAWGFVLLVAPTYAAPGLDPYTGNMAQNMRQVIDGQTFSQAFPWPMEAATDQWEAGFRSNLKAIEPVTVQTAALALNWTFFQHGAPIYVVQVVLMPTSKGPALMRLQTLWEAGEKPYPDWMVSTQGRQPDEWPKRFLPWAKVLAAFQKNAMPGNCPGLPVAGRSVPEKWVPAPYRQVQLETLKNMVPLRRQLCQTAYDADSVTMMPVRQHFNLVNESGEIRGGIVLEFKAGATGLVMTNPQFKQIGVPQ